MRLSFFHLFVVHQQTSLMLYQTVILKLLVDKKPHADTLFLTTHGLDVLFEIKVGRLGVRHNCFVGVVVVVVGKGGGGGRKEIRGKTSKKARGGGRKRRE